METAEMQAILKDVNAVVGVTGSFVCNDDGETLARALPDVFDDAMITPVGRTMAQTIAGLKIARRRNVGDIDLLYDQGRLIVKGLQEGCLCILCVRRINVPLLNLTANVAAKKLSQKTTALKAAKAAAPPQVSAPGPTPLPTPTLASQSETQPETPPEAETETPPEEPRRRTRAEIMAAYMRP